MFKEQQISRLHRLSKIKRAGWKRNKRTSRQTKSGRKMRAGLCLSVECECDTGSIRTAIKEQRRMDRAQRKGLVVVWNNRKTDRDRAAGQGVKERKRLGNTGKREGKQRSKGRVADNRTH